LHGVLTKSPNVRRNFALLPDRGFDEACTQLPPSRQDRAAKLLSLGFAARVTRRTAMEDPRIASSQRFDVKSTSSDHFAWIRTRLAIERTLMAWIRTATSLIGFGFTIVQFFQRFNEMQGVSAAAHPDAPRYMGLALIGAGVLGAITAIVQYLYIVGYLWEEHFRPIAGLKPKRMNMPALVAAFVVLAIGIFAFGAVFFRYV
jgi:putative membrane protein